jgi:hypothetical protein
MTRAIERENRVLAALAGALALLAFALLHATQAGAGAAKPTPASTLAWSARERWR